MTDRRRRRPKFSSDNRLVDAVLEASGLNAFDMDVAFTAHTAFMDKVCVVSPSFYIAVRSTPARPLCSCHKSASKRTRLFKTRHLPPYLASRSPRPPCT